MVKATNLQLAYRPKRGGDHTSSLINTYPLPIYSTGRMTGRIVGRSQKKLAWVRRWLYGERSSYHLGE